MIENAGKIFIKKDRKQMHIRCIIEIIAISVA